MAETAQTYQTHRKFVPLFHYVTLPILLVNLLIAAYYVVRAPGVPLTDLHVGSVARTLAESIAVEIAGLYAQLQAVYDKAHPHA